MPLKSGKLTDKELAFVHAFIRLSDCVLAARTAGYANENYGHTLMRNPRILAEVDKESDALLIQAKTIALQTCIEIMRDKTQPVAARNTAASTALRAATANVRPESVRDLEPHEMTADQLQARIANAEARLLQIAEGAKVIELQPSESTDVFG